MLLLETSKHVIDRVPDSIMKRREAKVSDVGGRIDIDFCHRLASTYNGINLSAYSSNK